MKIPDTIRKKLLSAYNHYYAGAKLMGEVEDWLEKKGIDPDDLRISDGNGLEEIEYAERADGTPVVDAIIKRIEEEF